jgi:protein-tyrosine phosphatase
MLGRPAVSAGLAADPGRSANSRAQKAAERRCVSLVEHRSQPISRCRLEPRDLLIAFEPDHALSLAAQVTKQPEIQVTLIGVWIDQPWWAYIHDPYGLSDQYFDRCFERIEHGLNAMLDRWDRGISNQIGYPFR